MSDIYEQAEQSYRDQCRAADSDSKWEKRTFRKDAEAYTEDDARRDEVQANHLTDAKMGLI